MRGVGPVKEVKFVTLLDVDVDFGFESESTAAEPKSLNPRVIVVNSSSTRQP